VSEFSLVPNLTKFNIELGDGRIFSGIASSVSISQNSFAQDRSLYVDTFVGRENVPSIYDIEIVGVMNLTLTENIATISDTHRVDVAVCDSLEWECKYCGAAMLREIRRCEACGGWRNVMEIDNV